MIAVDTTAVVATAQLVAAQAALDIAADDAAIELVEGRRGAWLTVRPALAEAQYRKCAYCEEILRERSTEVDHIRPKSPTRYWWLAFELRNLLATCRSCNNAKSEKWELQPGSRRLLARDRPWEAADPERAMLVDPTVDDPSAHLTFAWAEGEWRVAALTRRGMWTIRTLELDRDSYRRIINDLYRDLLEPEIERLQDAAGRGDRVEFERARDNLLLWAATEKPYAQFIRTVVQSELAAA